MNRTMKNTARIVIKRAGFLGLFLIATILVNAQSIKNDPSWMVSKDVQKIANKKNFENEVKRGSQLQANSISQLWVNSKGVHRAGRTEEGTKGNMTSKGIPAWTISKGVHQKNR